MDWRECYRSKCVTASEALAATITSGCRVFLTGNCGVPAALVAALVDYAPQVRDVELVHVLTVGPAPWAAPEMAGHLRANIMFIGSNVRPSVWEGRSDFTPLLLSEFPTVFRRGGLPLDVALAHLSPPDADGFCSFGVETGLARTPVTSARVIVAQINPQMPVVAGDTRIHVEALDYIVEAETPLYEHCMNDDPSDPVVERIAGHVSELIPDGATLQLGIGAIPDAILHYLVDKRDLGIHTELFSDGVMQLTEAGVITGARKTRHPGKIVAGFVLGSRELYRWVDRNPLVELYPIEYVNDPAVIGQNFRQVAINSALEVDLTGQVCADSLGPRPFSGVGGQLDFIYGASRSEGGVPIIALPSTAKQGTVSRIKALLTPGAGVTTTRSQVHWIVTEYGAVNLYGKSIRQRAASLISIAHPDFRDDLRREAAVLGYG